MDPEVDGFVDVRHSQDSREDDVQCRLRRLEVAMEGVLRHCEEARDEREAAHAAAQAAAQEPQGKQRLPDKDGSTVVAVCCCVLFMAILREVLLVVVIVPP